MPAKVAPAPAPAAPACPGLAWPGLAWSWRDQAKKNDGFTPSAAAERTYQKQLNSVAGRIRQIVAGDTPPDRKVELLRAYAASIGEWSLAAAAGMMTAVARKNDQQWRRHSKAIGAGLRDQLTATGAGPTLQTMIQVNANLIRSLPDGAADRIAKLTSEALVTGLRPEEMARKIEEAGDAEGARARTIARTEVSKANTALTRQRAQAIGSEGYIWRTSRDGGVRESHAGMEGKFVSWDQPPTLDGYTAHAGEFVNCRCYPEPVIPRPGAGRRVVASPLPTEAEAGGKPTFLSHWEKTSKQAVEHEPGQPLPGHEKADLPIAKLAGYVLDPVKSKGKSAAFQAALGMDGRHAGDLRDQLLKGLATARAERKEDGVDEYGERFTAWIPVTGPNGRTVEVKTGWIYDRKDGRQADAPRLTTAFIEPPAKPKQKEEARVRRRGLRPPEGGGDR